MRSDDGFGGSNKGRKIREKDLAQNISLIYSSPFYKAALLTGDIYLSFFKQHFLQPLIYRQKNTHFYNATKCLTSINTRILPQTIINFVSI